MNHIIKKLVIDTLESVFLTIKRAHLNNLRKNTPNQTIQDRIKQKTKAMNVEKMSEQQAMAILNIKNSNFNSMILNEKYKDMLSRNTQDLGGSLYIRSKIHNAFKILKK